MRTKKEILQGELEDLKQTTNAHQAGIIQNGLALEVLIDIRDAIQYWMKAIARSVERIADKQ